MKYYKDKNNQVYAYTSDGSQDTHIKPVLVAITEAEANALRFPPLSLEEFRSAKVAQIDAETSAAILAGFAFAVDGEALHFSYDTNDQQNFADTANAATLALMNVPGIPTSVTWNGWKVSRDDGGGETSRSLVRLNLSPNEFLGLYMGGALIHKATQMERGGQRKAAAEVATTVEALEGV